MSYKTSCFLLSLETELPMKYFSWCVMVLTGLLGLQRSHSLILTDDSSMDGSMESSMDNSVDGSVDGSVDDSTAVEGLFAFPDVGNE